MDVLNIVFGLTTNTVLITLFIGKSKIDVVGTFSKGRMTSSTNSFDRHCPFWPIVTFHVVFDFCNLTKL